MPRLIDADAIKSSLRALCDTTDCNIAIMSGMMAIVREAPTVDAEPVRHGYWTPVRFPNQAICSVCGGWSIGAMKYCPNCGAKMDGGKDDA